MTSRINRKKKTNLPVASDLDRWCVFFMPDKPGGFGELGLGRLLWTLGVKEGLSRK